MEVWRASGVILPFSIPPTISSAGAKNWMRRFAYEIGPDWTPLLLSGKFAGTDPSVTFGIQLQPGGSADLFAIQVEAQIGASGYKKTLSSCGVYPNARFLDDELAIQ